MKILVMGAGAVGGYFGARLQAAGEDVTLVARGAHLEAIRKNGIRLESGLGNLTQPIAATDTPADAGPADIVMFLVKLYDTAEAVEAIRPVVGAGTVVIPFQNGISARGALTEAFGVARVGGGVAYIGAEVEAPGVVRHSSSFARVVFGPFAATARAPLAALSAAFGRSGAEHALVDDINRQIWEKFIFLSAFSAITCLTRLPIGPVLADPASRELFRAAMAETLAVAMLHEPSVDPGIVEARMEMLSAPGSAGMKSSMLFDLERGRRLEVAELSGKVVALGADAGIPTPVHRAAFAALSPWRSGNPLAG
ncbi:ketopantoate reductase family protein [Acuticoccus sp. MNP-M23]|uniref:ketopantoate reductase family protein n=1 Tax=Acuticoccus sp. MNP-M23 TaxID=3072793 RepID=UPI002814DCC8|nr:ketopantoate reductase family protein [Acuticoccus sp. MNP-M23]WMS43404.1 ketopantoate reductase family protein [Acuticoccus sp. MNP-M23]